MSKGFGLLTGAILFGVLGVLIIIGSIITLSANSFNILGSIGLFLGVIVLFVGIIFFLVFFMKKVASNFGDTTETLAKKTRKATEIKYEAIGKGLSKGLGKSRKKGIMTAVSFKS